MFIIQLLTISLFIILQASAQGPHGGGQNSYCPSSCSSSYGYGTCSTSQRQCICNEGYFDTDCSQQIQQLTDGVASTISITEWGYFYIDLSSVSGDAVLTFESSQATLYYYLLLEGPEEYYLPSDYYTRGLDVSSDKTIQTVTITQSVLEYSDGGWLLIGAQNVDTSNTVTLTVTNTWSASDSDTESSSNNLVLILAISIGIVAFIIVCIITAYTCRKRRLMREQINEVNLNNNNPNRIPNVQGRPQQNSTNFLRKEELDGYFPVKGFSDIKSSFDQTSCSICLDDYNAKSTCRQLYCEHIFHGECIEEWLAKHIECPNCKSAMTKKSIKEFYKKKITEKKPQAAVQSKNKLSVRRVSTKQEASVVVEIPMENLANAPVHRNRSREIAPAPEHPNSVNQMNVSVILNGL